MLARWWSQAAVNHVPLGGAFHRHLQLASPTLEFLLICFKGLKMAISLQHMNTEYINYLLPCAFSRIIF